MHADSMDGCDELHQGVNPLFSGSSGEGGNGKRGTTSDITALAGGSRASIRARLLREGKAVDARQLGAAGSEGAAGAGSTLPPKKRTMTQAQKRAQLLATSAAAAVHKLHIRGPGEAVGTKRFTKSSRRPIGHGQRLPSVQERERRTSESMLMNAEDETMADVDPRLKHLAFAAGHCDPRARLGPASHSPPPPPPPPKPQSPGDSLLTVNAMFSHSMQDRMRRPGAGAMGGMEAWPSSTPGGGSDPGTGVFACTNPAQRLGSAPTPGAKGRQMHHTESN